jgi:DDE superfamily endonuclease
VGGSALVSCLVSSLISSFLGRNGAKRSRGAHDLADRVGGDARVERRRLKLGMSKRTRVIPSTSLRKSKDRCAGFKVHALVKDRHRSREFIEFLKLLDDAYPAHTAIKLILDNHSAHISKETRAWLADQPAGRFEFTFTPKHGSWLNLVEGFFSPAPSPAIGYVLCDCRAGVMRGAKWLVRHKMATLTWDVHRLRPRPQRARPVLVRERQTGCPRLPALSDVILGTNAYGGFA